MTLILARGLAGVIACASTSSMAAQFCVGTRDQLQDAFDVAIANGQDDTIRIVAGTLVGGSSFSSTEPHALGISGGYNSACTALAGMTTINGQGTTRPMWIWSNDGDIVVERITFINGLSTENRGGGLSAGSFSRGGGLTVVSGSGNIRIELNRFFANRANDRVGALSASTLDGQLTIRNNLAYANSAAAGGTFELSQNGPVAYIISNTIFDNDADTAPNTGGLSLWTGNPATIYVLSNNIIWGNTANGALDLSVSNARHVRVGNDIGTIDVRDGAPPPLLVENEQNVAPGFAPCAFPCLGFELARSSPLVDAGNSTPSGGLSALDLAGKPRVIGPRVDIGAYENERLFANGFD